jgi:beta-glucanase (GH16 family)
MYRYGSFSSRLKAASCAVEPRAGVVTGFFTFFNNGGDITGCGLPDNSEIDFEWLAAEPQVVHLTMWTNFRESDDAHRKVFREIDLATGTIRKTCYDEVWGVYQPLAGIEAQPAAIQAIPGYNSSTTYYEYGFTWAPNRVTWWIVRPDTGQPMILWDYRGPAARIPTIPAKLMTNVWHTNTWAPDAVPDALQQPATAVDAFVDWTKFSAYP